MRSVNGGLVIVLGFVLLYVAITGKFACLVACWQCLTGAGSVTPEPAPAGVGGGVSW